MDKLELLLQRYERGVRVWLWSAIFIVVLAVAGVAYVGHGGVLFADKMHSLQAVIGQNKANVMAYQPHTPAEQWLQEVGAASLEANRGQVGMFFMAVTVLLLKFVLLQGIIFLLLGVGRKMEVQRLRTALEEVLVERKVS